MFDQIPIRQLGLDPNSRPQKKQDLNLDPDWLNLVRKICYSFLYFFFFYNDGGKGNMSGTANPYPEMLK